MYQYSVKVVKVIDGDTIDVDIDLGFSVVLAKQRVRLHGIDTPESRTRDKEEKARGNVSHRTDSGAIHSCASERPVNRTETNTPTPHLTAFKKTSPH